MYEEPHPMTEPEAERLVVINCEKRFFHQKHKNNRLSTEDSMNFIPWDRSGDMEYQISALTKVRYFYYYCIYKK